MSDNMSWSFFQIWNKTLETREDRPVEPRDVVWASELGGSMIDRYLKMTGVAFTNPPNMRSLRKFEAGNVMEWIVGLILKRAGILIIPVGERPDKPNNWVSYQYPGLLRVTGKTDHVAGGKIEWKKAQEAIKELEALQLPKIFTDLAQNVVNELMEKYPDGMKQIVLEVKSCSSFMFEYYDKYGKANENHALQAFHYLKAKNMEEAHVLYICKDDLRILELGILNPSATEDKYKDDIMIISNFYQDNIMPPKENEIVFDEDSGRVSKNWKVEYSPYLTMLYNYSEPESYRARWDSEVASFNRTLTRVANGANMTKLNLEVLEKLEAYFPVKYNSMIEIAKKKLVKSSEQADNTDEAEV